MTEAYQASTISSLPAATIPTMYFIGVTTGKSSIMKVFPEWAKHLKLGNVRMQGIDCKWHDDPEVYRRVVDFIKRDPLSLGALVTTHKIDLLKACRDRFEELDSFAQLTGEISSISKVGKKLVGHAKDPITSGLALEAFLPKDYWKDTGAEILILGAGGSSIALSSYLLESRHASGAGYPTRIMVTNRSTPRLDEMKHIHAQLPKSTKIEYHSTPHPEDNDRLLAGLKPGSLVVNATGLGKDAPGSPLTDAAIFPERGLAWDFNYRGDLVFLQQAERQKASRQLQIEDGWVYFLHGWTRVIAEVFHIDIPVSGPEFEALSIIAKGTR